VTKLTKDEKLVVELKIIDLWRSGLSSRKIADREDVPYKGGASITRILRKHLTSEELESGRKKMIGLDVKAAYATGERDWITDINVARNKSEEGRAKNSEGVKRAYNEGRLEAWSTGLTNETSEKKRGASDKTSETMKVKAKNGNLLTLLPRGKDNLNWKGGISSFSNRAGLVFIKSDRISILNRAGYKCQLCGRSKQDMEREKKALSLNRWGIECDHIVPIVEGGQKDPENNGMALCTECHLNKSIVELDKDNSRFLERYSKINQTIMALEVGGKVADSIIRVNDKTFQLIDLKMPEWSKLADVMLFQDEWVTRRDVCKSLIANKSGTVGQRIFARKCKIVAVSKVDEREFLNSSHVSGTVGSSHSFGLEYEGELVSVITFRKPFTKGKEGVVEIARFCSKLNTIVVGGLSRLISHAVPVLKSAGYSKILTYAELRFGEGAGYLNAGFKRVGKTKPDYSYTDGYKRFHRFKYRASEGKSEREVAEEAGVYRIYGLGSAIYERDI